MYTEKSVAQSMKAINDRLHLSPTKTRLQLDGWVEKNGHFAMSVRTEIRWGVTRKTVLNGIAEKDGKITVIRGRVPDGASREGQALIFGAMVLLSLVMLSQGNGILAIVVLLAGLGLFVPLRGDYNNSEVLLTELQKTLQAKFKRPA